MSPTTKAKVSALAQLEELREEARQARRLADEMAAQARGAGRRRDAAANALRAFAAGQEGGDPRDPQREQKLRADLADIEKRTVARSSLTRGRQVTSYHDPVSEGRADAARDRADQAAGLVDEFVRSRSTELEAELIERSIAAGDRIVAAMAELANAAGHWQTVRNQWFALDLAQPAEITPPPDISAVALIFEQLEGGARDRRGIFPCPPRLAAGGENEERDAPPLRGWEHVPRVVSSQHGLGT